MFFPQVEDYSLLPGEVDLSPVATNSGPSIPPIVYQATDIFSRIYQLIKTGKDTGGPVMLPSQQAKFDIAKLAVFAGILFLGILAVRYVFKH